MNIINIAKTYIKFDENCLDYVDCIENNVSHNIFIIKTVIKELSYKYSCGEKIFLNDLLRNIGAEEIADGWNYGLMKGKSISPDELKIDYSDKKYIKIYLDGFIPANEMFEDIYPSYIVEEA